MELESSSVRLILASGSPRRKILLNRLGLEVEVIPSRIDESASPHKTASETVEKLALLKAEDVARTRCLAGALIIAADTVVTLESSILGKPANEKEAATMLRRLSGRTHDVWTGVALLHLDKCGGTAKKALFSERTKVTFAALTEEEILAYVRSGQPLDKAGSYGIQDDFGSLFVSRIEGDFYNVVGLPLHALYQHMKRIAPGVLSPDALLNEKL